ncbi:hypothetical protein Nans01_23560 [Nocardiopsis ansamitocini]|uniref:Uncharacterized protein n=2 Tax=Nocardiopsis ansamitocini TaxID=1670832 RepID=A0A9W6UJF5_9ACTN|nr:hypothetical protein Nans01_23560 [Nocardiopsis ansamitocini]
MRADGQTVLADALVRMPALAAEGDLDRIVAELPDALIGAEREGAPSWASHYLHYWAVAVRVGDRAEGAVALADAERLAHTVHAQGAGHCPPGACPTIAVLACHANADGPGHIAARAMLLAESLPHTQPGTPAFEALTLAFADMLIDDDRADEAIGYLDAQAEVVRATGVDVGLYYGFGYVRALRHLDRYDQALAVLDHLEGNGVLTWPAGPARSDAQRRVSFERARLLAWLARAGKRPVADALAALPPVEEAQAHPYLRTAWADAVEHLVALDALRNDWQLGHTLTVWACYQEEVGAHRRCLELSTAAARLAVRRGARWAAEGALHRAQRALFRVRRDDDLIGDLAEARTDTEELPAAASAVPADRLAAWLREEGAETDPETRADLLVAALAERPADTDLLNALGTTGRVLGLAEAAAQPQWSSVRADPGNTVAALGLLESLLHDDDTDGVRDLVRTLAEAAAHRMAGRVATV